MWPSLVIESQVRSARHLIADILCKSVSEDAIARLIECKESGSEVNVGTVANTANCTTGAGAWKCIFLIVCSQVLFW